MCESVSPDARSAIRPGTILECNEARADNPQHDFGANYTGLGSRYVRFGAVVDRVQGDYVEATVTTRNRHMKAPDPGDQLALSISAILEEDRWRIDTRDVDEEGDA